MPKIQTTKVYCELDKAVKSGYTTVSEQGSSRSGKSYNTVIWLCVFLMNHPGLRLSVVRKTLTALRGSILYDFKDVLVKMGLWGWRQKAFNKSEFTFTFPNGSWIEFFSTDDEQKLRGRKRDICYVNEANELSQLEWQQLKMRTTMFTIADYNPSFSDEHWLCQVNADPRTYHFITTYKDNPFLEQTIIDEIESLRHKNKSLWQVYGLGMQAVIEGLIFTNVEIIDEIPDVARKRRWRGCDWGYSLDPTAIEDVYYHDGSIYVDEICYRTGMLASDIISVLRENDGAVETICDSADPRLIQEVYRGGCNVKPVTKYPGSVLAGITKMQELRIFVTKRSANVIKEFKNYVWAQDKEGKWLQQPAAGAGDHCFVADTMILTNEGERRIADIHPGDYVLTSRGYRQVLENHNNGVKKVWEFSLSFINFNVRVRCTPDHKVKTSKGWKEIQNLVPGDRLFVPREALKRSRLSNLMEKPLDCIKERDTIQEGRGNSILLFGNIITGLFRKVMKFITKISIALTMTYQTLSAFLLKNTVQSTMTKSRHGQKALNNLRFLTESERRPAHGIKAKRGKHGTQSIMQESHYSSNRNDALAKFAGLNFGQKNQIQNIVPMLAKQKQEPGRGLIMRPEYANGAEKNLSSIDIPEQPIVQGLVLQNIVGIPRGGEQVYDLTVDEIHEYIANGIVVHNCIDGVRYVVSMKILGGKPKPVNMTRLANIAY